MQFNMRADEQVGVTLNPVDRGGNPAFFENLTLENSNPDVLEIIQATQQSPTLIRAKGPAGQSRVTIKADVREGPEVRELQDFIDFNIVPGEAVGLGLTLGAPTQIPTEPPVEPPVVTPPNNG